jgi:hypothetical protein
MDKKFVGRSRLGKYPEQVEIGLQQKDIDLLQEHPRIIRFLKLFCRGLRNLKC